LKLAPDLLPQPRHRKQLLLLALLRIKVIVKNTHRLSLRKYWQKKESIQKT
jgi:hypothetical protein